MFGGIAQLTTEQLAVLSPEQIRVSEELRMRSHLTCKIPERLGNQLVVFMVYEVEQ